ncbi:phosphodiesterase [Pseudohalocynthiibacter sp. F2068]|jgi:3',5'-cyclic-AMP phosphodiesterase|uniref:phosphodiesterase n=1 Tax=Pseudohalocynthiibacter sp. F2068 TaxID=2926418 RepID=UPI001FF4B6AD|nr:phosphodiesterase [Pseudohalocynthiibacter sp. F2068]MCK0102745.1 phosphodiesterase [Pseudohalocynthiibacter sp. F2068]
MTTILQISDTHIVPEGALVSERLETSGALSRLISRINTIQDQIGSIDVVLVSGDLSDDGSVQSYERFKALLAPLDLPIHVVPGNHDAREPMRGAFADHLPTDGPLNWIERVGDLVLIGLDTLVEGFGHGTLSPQTLSFLEDALSKAKGAPVLLAMHHPPFPSDIDFMDKIGLTNSHAFRDIVSDHAGALRIVCGHIHSMMVTDVGGHIAISAPSPCSTFAYDRRSDAPVGFMTLEDGCLLHRWDAGFQSIRIGPVAGPGPFPF